MTSRKVRGRAAVTESTSMRRTSRNTRDLPPRSGGRMLPRRAGLGKRGASAEIAAGDGEVVRVAAGKALAQGEGRLGARRFLVGGAGAVAQGVKTRGPVPQVLGDEVDDAFLALQQALAIEEGGAERGAAE